MSAMADMSLAIRTAVQTHGATLRDVPTDVLVQFRTILEAFEADIGDELKRRATPRIPAGQSNDVGFG